MGKRFIQTMVALAMVAGLVLGPIAPGAVNRRARQGRTPPRALAMSINGWDSGGSTGG
ncbi:MAG: hypothetical protein PVI07_05225 [Anaerolineae bacterium]|jgi:hypothetical protein